MFSHFTAASNSQALAAIASFRFSISFPRRSAQPRSSPRQASLSAAASTRHASQLRISPSYPHPLPLSVSISHLSSAHLFVCIIQSWPLQYGRYQELLACSHSTPPSPNTSPSATELIGFCGLARVSLSFYFHHVQPFWNGQDGPDPHCS